MKFYFILSLTFGTLLLAGCNKPYDPLFDPVAKESVAEVKGVHYKRIKRGSNMVFSSIVRTNNALGYFGNRTFWLNNRVASMEIDEDGDGFFEIFVLFSQSRVGGIVNLDDAYEVYVRNLNHQISAADKTTKLRIHAILKYEESEFDKAFDK